MDAPGAAARRPAGGGGRWTLSAPPGRRSRTSRGRPPYGLAGRMARAFLRSKLTPLIVLASILLGVAAVRAHAARGGAADRRPHGRRHGAHARRLAARGGEPSSPRRWSGGCGASPASSTSTAPAVPGAAMLTVRFKVNEPLEPSLVKVHQELQAHPELLPARRHAARWSRLLTIDDVPFLTLTLHGRRAVPAGELRKLAEEVARELAGGAAHRQVQVLGGARRDGAHRARPGAAAHACGVSLAELQPALRARAGPAPGRRAGGRRPAHRAGGARLRAPARRAARAWWWPSAAAGPSTWRTWPGSSDGPEPEPAVVLTATRERAASSRPSTIAVAKRAGTNATELARDGARQGGGAARPAHPRRGRRSPSRATTARPPARSRTSSSSTCSSPPSR